MGRFDVTGELYDVALDEWHYQQPMQSSRSELATVLLAQRIYAIGGTNTLGPASICREI